MGGCIMYTGIRLLLLICPFISSFFFVSNFQTLQIFVTLWGLEGWNMVNTWTIGRCIVYTRIRLLLIHPIIFFIFLSLQFSNIKIFRHTFLRNCEAYKIETWYVHGQWADVWCLLESGCCLFIPLFLNFSFCPIFKHYKFSSHFSQKLWGLEGWNLVHTWTVGRCIMYTGIRLLLLLIHPIFSSFFFLSNF